MKLPYAIPLATIWHGAESLGYRLGAFHELIPGHQLNILWKNAVSDLYIFDLQQVDICLALDYLDVRAFHTTAQRWATLES